MIRNFVGGRFADATRWLAEADLHFERNDTFGSLVQVRALMVAVEIACGNHEATTAAYERVIAFLKGELD